MFSDQKQETVMVDKDTNIEDFIGPPIFQSKKFYDAYKTPPGVVMGLAYNAYGGSVLYIEATKSSFQEKQGGVLKVTGSLGEVMKESSTIAQTYAKNFLDTHFKDHDLKPMEKLETQDLHIHFPEGAVPKDGPSAGVAITSALVGLALGQPTIRHVGMTGEISLNGKVLPIGGVKEKTMAAKREGLKTLILPSGNSKEVKKLPDNITDGIEFHFVSTFEDAFKVLYPGFKLNN